jgi:hypothetical protein
MSGSNVIVNKMLSNKKGAAGAGFCGSKLDE